MESNTVIKQFQSSNHSALLCHLEDVSSVSKPQADGRCAGLDPHSHTVLSPAQTEHLELSADKNGPGSTRISKIDHFLVPAHIFCYFLLLLREISRHCPFVCYEQVLRLD